MATTIKMLGSSCWCAPRHLPTHGLGTCNEHGATRCHPCPPHLSDLSRAPMRTQLAQLTAIMTLSPSWPQVSSEERPARVPSLAVPSARMERRARGRCAAMRPCCRRLATGRASHAGWHALCRRSCCRAAEGGRERRARRGRSSAAQGRPKRASAGRPRRACRPRRRLLGAGSGASGPRTKHIQVKVTVRGVCAACSAALR